MLQGNQPLGLKSRAGFKNEYRGPGQDEHEVATMKHVAQTTFAEGVGRTLGRLWQSCVRLDRRATNWLVARGWKPGVAKALLMVLKLGPLLYTTLWLALLLAFALAGAIIIRNDNGSYDEEHKAEWEHGPAGYGLYSYDGHRIDPHDPEDEQD
jgi:hypothetical protein